MSQHDDETPSVILRRAVESGLAPDDDNRLRVKYEVPLVWILGMLLFLAGQAAIVYFAQVRQGELIAGQSEAIKDLVQQVRSLSGDLSGKNLKDVEHDLRIADHERRILALEAASKGPKP